MTSPVWTLLFCKFTLDGQHLVLRDYFTPSNQSELNDRDNDLGSSGPVLLPDQPSAHPHFWWRQGKKARST